jgi:hypothetical protein
LKEEVTLARSLDRRPILIQDAGEFGTWYKTARDADILGVSLYRSVWWKGKFFIHYPGIISAYRLRAAMAGLYVNRVINTELQTEPWEVQGITTVPIPDQLKQMNPDVLTKNVEFARRIGFPEVYFWGVEWWYWLKTQGFPELWETGQGIIRESNSSVISMK